jgi:site-specific recombinase
MFKYRIAEGMSAEEAMVVIRAVLGVGVIGILNVGVSFILALILAVRSQNRTIFEAFKVMAWLPRSFLRNPKEFFFPPKC